MSTNVVKRHYSDLLQVLSTSQDTLFVVTGGFYQADLIDRNTKTSVFSPTASPIVSSRILLDHIEMKVEQSNDYLPMVLLVLGEQVALKDIVVKMNKLATELEEKRNTDEQTESTLTSIPMVEGSSDIAGVVSAAERLKESFDALLFMLVSIVSRANINLLWLKLRINLFLQYARETTPEVRNILDELEVHGHSPEGVVLFLVNRHLLGYLNFELLSVFMQFLAENKEINDRLTDYRAKHKSFISQNLKNIVKVFKQNPRLTPASVVGLPVITVHLKEQWQGKSYYQWKEIMQNTVDWSDHLLIKSIDINCVVITYHVLPFILSRVVNDLSNETVIRRFTAVGATLTVSAEVLELARSDSEWISSVIQQAAELRKKQIEHGEEEDEGTQHVQQQQHSQHKSQPVVQSSPALVPPEGGYDDEMFLSPPPIDLQCPICQLTLREPHQLTCCGAQLCQVCAVNTGSRLQCPCCRDTNHLMILDKKTRQRVVSLKVKCTKTDCHWCGELLDLDSHMNRKCPQPIEYQLDLVPEWTYPVLSTLQYGTLPVYRTIEDFRTNKQNNAVLYTDPFYTTKGGYKVTLRVNPNGQGSGKGTHISAFIHLMKGEHDHNLPFPFSGIFTIKLLNWEQDTGHVEVPVPFNEAIPVKCRERVTATEIVSGVGLCAFLSHSKLEENSAQQYVYQDMLCFQIIFEPIQQIGSPVPSWCDVMSGKSATPPCTRTLYSYTAYKRTNREWLSVPFYTGDKGYKLDLLVCPHVGDVGIDLLPGEHDDSLKWPLTADITLQLLNWRGDNNHLEWTFHHDPSRVEACKRVTQRVRAPAHLGYRHGFITDSVLHRVNTDTEYLRDDNLCFKILRVNVV